MWATLHTNDSVFLFLLTRSLWMLHINTTQNRTGTCQKSVTMSLFENEQQGQGQTWDQAAYTHALLLLCTSGKIHLNVKEIEKKSGTFS